MKQNTQLTTFVFIIVFFLSGSVLAQGDSDDGPVIPPFETQSLIDNQTTFSPYKGSFSMEIQHRFAQIKELSDLFGIYGSANTRLGFSYGITDRIMVGLGTTRTNKLQDLEWKVGILTQTQSWRIPLSLTYYGNAVLDARPEKYFGPEEDYKFAYRLSYLHQLILSQRLGDKIGYQIAPTFVYHNAVPEGYRNDNYAINFGARLQVLGFHSIILEYDQPLVQPTGDNAKTVYPNMVLGVEIGTSTHSFRVFASNYNYIIKNQSIAFNGKNPFDGDFQFGFNITIRFR